MAGYVAVRRLGLEVMNDDHAAVWQGATDEPAAIGADAVAADLAERGEGKAACPFAGDHVPETDEMRILRGAVLMVGRVERLTIVGKVEQTVAGAGKTPVPEFVRRDRFVAGRFPDVDLSCRAGGEILPVRTEGHLHSDGGALVQEEGFDEVISCRREKANGALAKAHGDPLGFRMVGEGRDSAENWETLRVFFPLVFTVDFMDGEHGPLAKGEEARVGTEGDGAGA